MSDISEMIAVGWRPMEDAPQDGTVILLRYSQSSARLCFWSEGRQEWVEQGTGFARNALVWMPQ